VTKDAARRGVHKALKEVHRRFDPANGGTGVPLLDPVADMGVTSEPFLALLARQAELQGKIAACPFHTRVDRDAVLELYSTRVDLLEKVGGGATRCDAMRCGWHAF
jgi:hypothetical protein